MVGIREPSSWLAGQAISMTPAGLARWPAKHGPALMQSTLARQAIAITLVPKGTGPGVQ